MNKIIFDGGLLIFFSFSVRAGRLEKHKVYITTHYGFYREQHWIPHLLRPVLSNSKTDPNKMN
jgi:hypothetical protein